MNKNWQNNVLSVSDCFLVVLSLGVLSWGYYNYRQAQNVSNPSRTISFAAEGTILAKPDIAVITASVITQGSEASQVQNENNTRMQQVIDFVKKQGVSEEDLQTINYALTPQYDYSWCRKELSDSRSCPPKIVGYELTQTLQIKIRDFNKITNLVGGLSAAGANQISAVSFEIDDPEDYKNQARILALQKVTKRAQLLSKETSLKLGRIVNITESINTPIYFKASNALESAAAPAPVEAGTKEIVVNLTVTYELK